MDKVLQGKFSFDYPEFEDVSKEAKNLVMKLLEYDPDKRISAKEALTDPWFKTNVESQVIDKPLAIQALKNLRSFRVY